MVLKTLAREAGVSFPAKVNASSTESSETSQTTGSSRAWGDRSFDEVIDSSATIVWPDY